MQQTLFKEEQKKAKEVKRKLELLEMRESASLDASSNIIMPKYVMNDDLKIYIECDAPPKSIYKPIGFNDLNKVKEIMEGDDSEKRSNDFKEQALLRKSTISLKK